MTPSPFDSGLAGRDADKAGSRRGPGVARVVAVATLGVLINSLWVGAAAVIVSEDVANGRAAAAEAPATTRTLAESEALWQDAVRALRRAGSMTFSEAATTDWSDGEATGSFSAEGAYDLSAGRWRSSEFGGQRDSSGSWVESWQQAVIGVGPSVYVSELYDSDPVGGWTSYPAWVHTSARETARSSLALGAMPMAGVLLEQVQVTGSSAGPSGLTVVHGEIPMSWAGHALRDRGPFEDDPARWPQGTVPVEIGVGSDGLPYRLTARWEAARVDGFLDPDRLAPLRAATYRVFLGEVGEPVREIEAPAGATPYEPAESSTEITT